MNIPVLTASGKVIVRPDTTWEKDNEDLYVPEFAGGLSYTPVLFARVSKPGRSIAAKFADRYYDGIGYGVLLYPEALIDGSEEGFACASCLDHTSFLPFPLYNKVTLGIESNEFILKKNGRKVFSFNKGEAQMIESAIESVSKMVYLRIGDIVAIELQGRKILLKPQDGKTQLSATYCGNFLLDFSIIM